MTKDDEIRRLQQWVSDLQSGMYINCVYCGHRYGPNSEVPATMADVLKKHVEACPKHPMSKLREVINTIEHRIERCQYLGLEALTVDGGHHKQWYLEEMLRALGVDYERWPAHDTGVAP